MILQTGQSVRWRLPVPVLVAVILPVAIFVLMVPSYNLAVPAAAMLLGCSIALAAWRWPSWGLVVFAAFMPVNRFVILAVLHFTGSEQLSQLFLIWKDVLVGVLFLRAAYELLFTTTPKRIQFLDLLVGAFLVMSLVYLIYPGNTNLDPLVRIQGWRSDVSFLLAYFAGRGIQLTCQHVRWASLALIPGTVVVAAVAVWQFILPSQATAVFTALGGQSFTEIQVGLRVTAAEAVRSRSIPGVDLARASSLQLGDLALAFYCIFLVSVAAAFLIEARADWRRFLAAGFLGAVLITLATTITRSAIFAAGPLLVVLAVFTRSIGRLVSVGLVALGVVFTVGALGLLDFDLIAKLVSLQDASAYGHVDALNRSLDVIRDRPFGQGLGTAGTIGQRFFTSDSITNENWFLQIATEMGVISGVLYFVIVVVLFLRSLAEYSDLRDVWLRIIVLSVAGGALGFLIVGNFLHAWENTVLSMLFWFFAGIAMRARRLDASASYHAAR